MHLYLMQNESGLFKIGKSANPEQRHIRLARQLKTRIKLIVVLYDRGHEESEWHELFDDFHLDYEWFDGSMEARALLSEQFSLAKNFSFPYEYKSEDAAKWLEQFYDVQMMRTIKRARRRLIRRLKFALLELSRNEVIDFEFLDHDIARALQMYDNPKRYYDFRDDIDAVQPYTTSIEAMKYLLPKEERTPYEVGGKTHLIEECISALAQRWSIDLDKLRAAKK